jgi:UDP-N-acetylmuramate--alanine ligase
MMASFLEAADQDPTVINGGIINAYGTNARLGSGEWMVVEADESDGTFTKLPSTIAVVTNIDPEHLDFYGDVETLHAAFETFVENIPFYGFAVLCIDHPAVQTLIGRIRDRRIVTYGVSPQADVRLAELSQAPDGATFTVEIDGRGERPSVRMEDLHLPMVGQHNVLNALAAIAVSQEMGMTEAQVRKALSAFAGVKRRFTKTGEVDGVSIIDDYGHHPVEIAAVLKAGRWASRGRVIAVVQPHRYSRLAKLFEDFCTCFNDADQVIVADVYPAGEEPIEGADRDALVEGLRAHGHRQVLALEGPDQLARVVRENARSGDLVVCLGAGSITNWAQALPQQLETLKAGGGTA